MENWIIEPIERGDASALCEICQDVFRKEFHITEEKIVRDLLTHKEYAAEASGKLVDKESGTIAGFIGVKVSGNQKLYPQTAWVSLFAVRRSEQKKGYGKALLSRTLELLTAKGVHTLYIGMDFNNFFSGIPDPDERKRRFFGNAGFALNAEEHFDLEADIVQNAAIDAFDDTAFRGEFTVTTYKENRTELLEFLEKEFPGRWVFEAAEATQELRESAKIVLLWNKQQIEIVGYCMLSSDSNGYGGLGPIGIAQKIRGRHVGDYLLYESLLQARRIQVTRVNIDWTILRDFYGQFDFVPERTYLGAYRQAGNTPDEGTGE